MADAGYRSEDNFKALAGSKTELVVAMGREGKRCAEVDAQKNPHTAASQAANRCSQGRVPQAQVDRRAAQRLDQERAGVPSIQLRGLHRVQAEFKLVCLALNLRRMGSLGAI